MSRSAWAVRFAAVVALWFSVATAGMAQAPAPERLIRQHLEALGARVPEPPLRLFLQQGESVVRAEQLGPGCTGFLAFGAGSVRDVDLSLMAPGGLVIDEDSLVAPFGYVRACAERAIPVFVDVSLYAGRGELLFLRVEQAPAGLGLLPGALELAAPSGGRPERPRSVGPGLPPRSLAERLEAADERWNERGYVPSGAPLSVRMGGGLSSASVPLEQGLCYAVIVRSEPSRQIAVAVADSAGRRWAGSSRGSSATAYVCPRSTEEHTVLVRAQPGGPTAYLRALVQMDAKRHTLPEGASDRAAAWAGELSSHFDARGLSSRVLGEGWVDSVGSLHWPVQLEAGHCYAHGAVVLAATSRATLTLAMEAPDGQLLARHKARDRWPRVYHCPRQSGTYQLVLEAQGEVGKVALFEGSRRIGGGEVARAR